MEQRLKKAQFTFDDYLEYMAQIRNMGGLSSLLKMIPGVGGQIKKICFLMINSLVRLKQLFIR